jgi:hypothetical protein
MAFSCNIDRRGRLARLIYGIVIAAIGVFLIFTWAVGSGSAVRWVVCVALVLSGAFAVFEAMIGWCVVRAMGFRTPM